MEDIFNVVLTILGVGISVIAVFGYPILAIFGTISMNRYTKRQMESGEDKQILKDFAATIFKQPENYTFAVGNNTKTERHGNTTTYYYYSYLLAFNQEELHVISFKTADHKPVCRNIMTFNYAEMQLTHKRKKKALEINLYYAGELLHMTVPDLVKGTNNDKSDTPYAVEQAHEVQMLEQMLMQYEARSYQLQVGNRVRQAV